MKRIRILDPLTANQIAAGEVVERPVSVVKELVENSIDAGSTIIKVSVKEGGLKEIRIADNGWGMIPEDIPLALKRHATSKISHTDDLTSLMTLGFRGEALPSIAAVSRLTVTSRIETSDAGFEMVFSETNLMGKKEIGCPVGTTILVEDLFFNTPARKKFLKSSSGEYGQIADLVDRLAISRPDISFELINEDKPVFKSAGNGELKHVLLSVYGRGTARLLKEISADEDGIKVAGFVSLPQLTRSTRHYYTFIVNGRLVKSGELAAILEEFYFTRIPAKRYPLAAVHFQLDPSLFDVNVHPAKLEIKFKDMMPIKRIFQKALASMTFEEPALIPHISESKSESQYEIKPVLKTDIIPEIIPEHKPVIKQETILAEPAVSAYEHPPEDETEPTLETPATPAAFFSSLNIMGQLEGTYIIAGGSDGLYIIDQHAAHERIRYEKIKKIYEEEPAASNLLAVPLTMELTHQQAGWLIDHILKLADLGFVIEHFGDNTFIIRGTPKWHENGDAGELLLDLLVKMDMREENCRPDDIFKEKLFSLACKSAVKANRYLTQADMTYLMQSLDRLDNPFSCPHGRPVLLKITSEEIKKRFLRT